MHLGLVDGLKVWRVWGAVPGGGYLIPASRANQGNHHRRLVEAEAEERERTSASTD